MKMSLTLLILRVRGCHIDFIYTVFHVESEYPCIQTYNTPSSHSEALEMVLKQGKHKNANFAILPLWGIEPWTSGCQSVHPTTES